MQACKLCLVDSQPAQVVKALVEPRDLSAAAFLLSDSSCVLLSLLPQTPCWELQKLPQVSIPGPCTDACFMSLQERKDERETRSNGEAQIKLPSQLVGLNEHGFRFGQLAVEADVVKTIESTSSGREKDFRSRNLFLTVAPSKAGSCTDFQAWFCDTSFSRVPFVVDNEDPFYHHMCKKGSLSLKNTSYNIRVDIPHGISLKLAASVNFIAAYSASQGMVWLLAAKMRSAEITENMANNGCSFQHSQSRQNSLHLYRCRVVDCVSPVYSIYLSPQHLLLGEKGGVRIFPLRPLVKPARGQSKRKDKDLIGGHNTCTVESIKHSNAACDRTASGIDRHDDFLSKERANSMILGCFKMENKGWQLKPRDIPNGILHREILAEKQSAVLSKIGNHGLNGFHSAIFEAENVLKDKGTEVWDVKREGVEMQGGRQKYERVVNHMSLQCCEQIHANNGTMEELAEIIDAHGNSNYEQDGGDDDLLQRNEGGIHLQSAECKIKDGLREHTKQTTKGSENCSSKSSSELSFWKENPRTPSAFIPFHTKDKLRKAHQAVSIQALSPRSFLVLDSSGNVNILAFGRPTLARENLEGVAGLHMETLKVPFQVASVAVMPSQIPSKSSARKLWLSDGGYAIHVVSSPEFSAEDYQDKSSVDESSVSVLQVLFTSERVTSLLAISADTLLAITQGSIFGYVASGS